MRDMIWILSTFSFLCATAAAYSMLRTTSLSTSRLIHALIFLLAARLCPRHGSIVGDMPLLTKCCTLPTPLSSGSTQLGVVWLILLLTSQSVPFSGQLGVGDISRFITLSDRSLCFFFMVLLDDTFLRTVIKELLLLGCSSFSSSTLSLALALSLSSSTKEGGGGVIFFREDEDVFFFCVRCLSRAASFALCRFFDGLYSPRPNKGMACVEW